MVHQEAVLSYRQSNCLLAIDGLHLSSKAYYNSRHPDVQQTMANQLDVLFQALETGGFHYRTRYSWTVNQQTGTPEARELEQVFFCSSDCSMIC